ncbi:MAG: hypothetical protein IJ772_04550 [Bacilli bacterium]|nr:hypothetical protein [Bacilli bacterium]
MSDEKQQSTEVQSANAQFHTEELNIGVWWTMKATRERSSLSVAMVDKGLRFRFTNIDETGNKRVIDRVLPKTSVYLFKLGFKAFLADRLALAKQAFDANTSPSYSAIPENVCVVNTAFFSKEQNEYVVNGHISLGTTNIEGKERMCITGYDASGNSIRVVFHEEAAGHLLQKASAQSVVDTEDLGFYIFCLEIEQSMYKTVEYTAFAKIMWYLRNRLGPNANTKLPQKSTFGSFFKKREDRVQIGDETGGAPEADSDLFDTGDDGESVF